MRSILGFVAVAVSVVLLPGCIGASVEREWSASADVPVCDSEQNCFSTVDCRETSDAIEIRLPDINGSPDDWNWEEDMSGRCDSFTGPADAPVWSEEEEWCLRKTEQAIERSQIEGINEEAFMPQKCIEMGF